MCKQYDFGKCVIGEKKGGEYVLCVAGDTISCKSRAKMMEMGKKYGDGEKPRISAAR